MRKRVRLFASPESSAGVAHKIIAESTSFVEEFSPVSTFHASSEAAFPNPLDLALTLVLHIVLFSIEDDNYYSPVAVISLNSIGSVNILLPNQILQSLLPHFSIETPCFDISAKLRSLQLPYLALTNA